MTGCAADLVTLPGRRGRLLGETYDASVTTNTPDDLAAHVRGLVAVGATLAAVLDASGQAGMYQWPRRLLLRVGRRLAAPAGAKPGEEDKEASS